MLAKLQLRHSPDKEPIYKVIVLKIRQIKVFNTIYIVKKKIMIIITITLLWIITTESKFHIRYITTWWLI